MSMPNETPNAVWEKVLCHFDERGELVYITRGNGGIHPYKVEPLGFEEYGDMHGANTVAFNNLHQHGE